ncbi:hypothetical protein [Kiloniella litopenaei]|uniref:hypothetical protein n=1 Tax=Kiloniella litopenaei TaxID=1549748 RepID=UPI003BABFE7B
MEVNALFEKNIHPDFRCIRFFLAPVSLLSSLLCDQFMALKKASYVTHLSTLHQGGAKESFPFKINQNSSQSHKH